MIALESFPYRLTNLEAAACFLLGLFWLETYKGFFAPFWLQMGIARVLADSGDGDERTRRDRRMIGSLTRGTSLDAGELFRVEANVLSKRIGDWQNQASFAKLNQWAEQSCSVTEYLCGRDSPEERRAKFRGFVQDLPSAGRQDEVFQRHFGHGFDRLLEDWRQWVLDHRPGAHGPPPLRITDALVNGTIPTIKNRQAQLFERIQAVRAMGQAGYALGADTLISLLRSDDEIPPEEVVWSLEAISGLVLGDDPDRWTAWWQSLPEEARRAAKRA